MTPGPGLQRTLLPKGFRASGVNCGVRRYRPDVGMIISDVPATAAGVFTLNTMQAAPVLYSKELCPSDNIRAIITNSGQANAATGEQGVKDNLAFAEAAANALGCNADQVLVASTGVIGQRMDIEKLVGAMPELVDRANEVAENFALSILTTDLVPKSITTVVTLSEGIVRITGVSKGSGMIHPNMATMLGYLMTDVKLDPGLCYSLLKETTDQSFNMISVDGDTSTNDCVFLMANGASGVALKNHQDILKFKTALLECAQFLAKSIAADGEGASKLIEIHAHGAADVEVARAGVRAVTTSPLVKTAIHGEDPNWGRILAKLGASGVPVEWLNKMDLKVQGHLLFRNGAPVPFERQAVREALKQSKVDIYINFHSGMHEAVGWGCDLSKKYIDINTEYS
jgi:glutamate N-acetyltransferase/amino-acid N-acetyltransferase